MSELVSVIIPVYNVESYLFKCITSIVNQYYRNLEIILIDDGSTDHSGKICDEWAEKDRRIRVFHKNHEGVSIARNTGLLECNGQLIGFVDADDWIEPDMYERMVEKLIHSNAEIVMCGYYSYPEGAGKSIAKGILPTNDGTFEDTAISIIKPNGYFLTVWNKLFRREVIFRSQRTIMMDSSLSYGEDELWLFEVLRECKWISFIPQALYHWRSREESLSRGKDYTQNRMSIVEVRKKIFEMLPSSKSVQNVMKSRTYSYLHGLKTRAYMTNDRDNYQLISEFIKPFLPAFIKSSEISILRKMEVCMHELCMRIRIPIGIINAFKFMKHIPIKKN